MTTKGNIDRDQAIALVGKAAVDAVERKNCEPTNRVGYNGSCQGDDLTEWSASIACQDRDGDDCTLVIYYYTDQDDEDYAKETGDWGGIDWGDKIAGYEII